jgi:hypothetical protein
VLPVEVEGCVAMPGMGGASVVGSTIQLSNQIVYVVKGNLRTGWMICPLWLARFLAPELTSASFREKSDAQVRKETSPLQDQVKTLLYSGHTNAGLLLVMDMASPLPARGPRLVFDRVRTK